MKKASAFPFTIREPGRDTCHLGLTKREYFAALAMQANLSVPMDEDAKVFFQQRGVDFAMREMAKSAVHAADALLAELEKAGELD